ncbi:hypothetical protein LEN_0264 [Lysobacter enzymogenes]|uniref:Uncharacterized protein n=1 Tax=Lysobacter enzymogenes TaxID=69 RepID=A0AAU9ABG9_LYSEN|nr:hypothetical protein LEN_0264 [Lysobacter enzymogenes]
MAWDSAFIGVGAQNTRFWETLRVVSGAGKRDSGGCGGHNVRLRAVAAAARAQADAMRPATSQGAATAATRAWSWGRS